MFPKVEFFTRINRISHDLVKSGGQVGTIRLDDGRSLAIYTFEVSDNVLINRNRKGLREIAAKRLINPLFMVFWLSTIQRMYPIIA